MKQCRICQRTYSKMEHVRRHERSHTKERPYQCTVCGRSFSRSDVLRRHMKGHGPENVNGNIAPATSLPSGDGQVGPPADEIVVSQPSNDAQMSSTQPAQGTTTSTPISAALGRPNPEPSIRTTPNPGPTRGPHSQMPGEITRNVTDVDNTCAQKAPQSQSQLSDSGVDVASLAASTSGPNHDIGPSGENYYFNDLLNFPFIGDFLVDPSYNMAEPWIFQVDHHQTASPISNLLPPSVYNDLTQLGRHPVATRNLANKDDVSEAGSTFANGVSEERFARIQSWWQGRSSRTARLMPCLWQNLAASGTPNLFCKPVPKPSPTEAGQRRASRWGFDEDCRQKMQTALGDLNRSAGLLSPQSTGSVIAESPEQSTSTATADAVDILLPSREACEVALEIYFHQFHPTLPVIHLPTFSAKGAPFSLLLVMCLLGFTILSTPGATKFVSQTFPLVIRIVSTELQSCTTRRGLPTQEMTSFVTALLALNLAAIIGPSALNKAQAENLYVNLLSVAQWHGLFSANENIASPDEVLETIVDKEKQWQAWSRIESVKRLIVGLVEIDCWFASLFSTCPIVRPATVQIVPPSDNGLFHAVSVSVWMQLARGNKSMHMPCITCFYKPTTMDMHPSGLHALLALIQLRTYEATHRLTSSSELSGTNQRIEPWRLCAGEARDQSLITVLTNLPSTNINPLQKADINGVVLWHISCIMLTADLRVFEKAAGRCGSAQVLPAFRDIAAWACTPPARRACVHAAQAYKLLFHRKVSDIVNVQTVVALFKSALVLAFYLLTAPSEPQTSLDRPVELYDEIDWSRLGTLGLSEPISSDEGWQLSPSGEEDQVARFITSGGAFSITGIVHPPGYSSSRRVLLHTVDLLQTMGKWKSRTFLQILHLLTDDLMDLDMAENDEV